VDPSLWSVTNQLSAGEDLSTITVPRSGLPIARAAKCGAHQLANDRTLIGVECRSENGARATQVGELGPDVSHTRGSRVRGGRVRVDPDGLSPRATGGPVVLATLCVRVGQCANSRPRCSILALGPEDVGAALVSHGFVSDACPARCLGIDPH